MMFVPTQDVQKLLYGSYEHLIARVDEAVQADCEKLFGEECEAQTLGVFPGSAIVGNGNGKFVRVKFEDVKGQKLRLLDHEDLEVPVVNESNLDKFVAEEAGRAVEDILRGDSEAAANRVRGLTFFVEERTEKTDQELTESWIASMATERPWRRLYKEQTQKIRKFLWGELTSLEENRLTPKFKKLYDGSTADEDLETFRESVLADLSYIAERVEALVGVIEEALGSTQDLTQHLADPEDDAVLTLFSTLAEDLIEDLRGVKHITSEASENVGCVSCLGELYDNLATGLYDYEVAGRFIERMAAKLKDAR